jgi:CRISPR-associated protein Cmr6
MNPRPFLPRDAWEALGRDWKKIRHPYLLWNRFPPAFDETGRLLKKTDPKGWNVLFPDLVKQLGICDATVLRELDRRARKAAATLTQKGSDVLEIEARQVERLVSGQGDHHALEAGFRLHPVFGVPFLPGSGLKGALRHALLLRLASEQGLPDLSEETLESAPRRLRDIMRSLFGTAIKDARAEERSLRADRVDSDHAGRVIALDAFPLEGAKSLVEADVLTPHLNDYQNPVPVPYLVVPVGVRWRFVVALAPPWKGAQEQACPEESGLLRQALEDALTLFGLGGKTGAGHGRFRIEKKAQVEAGQAPAPDLPLEVSGFLEDVRRLDFGKGLGPARQLLQNARQKAPKYLDRVAKALLERLKRESPALTAEMTAYCRERLKLTLEG